LLVLHAACLALAIWLRTSSRQALPEQGDGLDTGMAVPSGAGQKLQLEPSDDSSGVAARAEFAVGIFDEELDDENLRIIKVECPGVGCGDVQIEVITNGCIISIERASSHGVQAASWTKRIQFPLCDGFFEFKEDEAQLEQGLLKLVFRCYGFQSHIFRFPHHLDNAALHHLGSDLHDGDQLEVTDNSDGSAPSSISSWQMCGSEPCNSSAAGARASSFVALGEDAHDLSMSSRAPSSHDTSAAFEKLCSTERIEPAEAPPTAHMLPNTASSSTI